MQDAGHEAPGDPWFRACSDPRTAEPSGAPASGQEQWQRSGARAPLAREYSSATARRPVAREDDAAGWESAHLL